MAFDLVIPGMLRELSEMLHLGAGLWRGGVPVLPSIPNVYFFCFSYFWGLVYLVHFIVNPFTLFWK